MSDSSSIVYVMFVYCCVCVTVMLTVYVSYYVGDGDCCWQCYDCQYITCRNQIKETIHGTRPGEQSILAMLAQADTPCQELTHRVRS